MPFPHYFVWFVFIVTCVQQAFLFPDLTIVPEERANLFSGFLCFLSLISGLVILGVKGNGIRISESIISIVLACLALTSSALSETPGVSFARSFVIMSSMLGGYWISRLLLNSVASRLFFVRLCLVLLAGVVFLTFLGLVTSGNVYEFLDTGAHQVVSRIIILSFAPISLLFSGSVSIFLTGVISSILVYFCLLALAYYGTVRTGLVIPFGFSFVALIFLKKTRRLLLPFGLVILISLLSATAAFYLHTGKMAKESQSIAYRIENLFFSTHLALENPVLGIGPSAPRSMYIDSYEIRYPFLSKDTFREWSDTVKTSENVFLTLLADLGFPFVFLYLSALICLLWKLVKLAWTPPTYFTPAPLSLLLAIVGSLVHFQVFDGHYLPQISWFFHILLGMIARPAR